jgi:hypothetical protein
MVLPGKIWICPGCKAQFVEAWRLKRHLMLTHELSERRAWDVTDQSEYWLRIRQAEYVNPAEFGPYDSGGQAQVKNQRRRRQ